MDCCSEELSQPTYGFIITQVNTAYWSLFGGQSKLKFVRAFHLSNHPNSRLFLHGSWDQWVSSMTWGLLGRKFTWYLVYILNTQRGKWGTHREMKKEEKKETWVLSPFYSWASWGSKQLKNWPTTHHLAKANVSVSNGKAFSTHLSFRQKCHIASRYQ